MECYLIKNGLDLKLFRYLLYELILMRYRIYIYIFILSNSMLIKYDMINTEEKRLLKRYIDFKNFFFH